MIRQKPPKGALRDRLKGPLTTYDKGMLAEGMALLYLWGKGYRLRAWRYKAAGGEIDLVMTRARLLVFIEVKTRPRLDDAIAAIVPASYARLRAAGAQYIAQNRRFKGHDIRFDLVAVALPFSIRHLDNVLVKSA